MSALSNAALAIVGACLLFILFGLGFVVLIQFATRKVAGFKPGYRRTFIAWSLGWLATSAGGIAANGKRGAIFVVLAIVLLVKPLIYHRILKSAEGNPISFGKSVLLVIIEGIIVAMMIAAFMLYSLLTLRAQM